MDAATESPTNVTCSGGLAADVVVVVVATNAAGDRMMRTASPGRSRG
jgi:hypothetical protein